MEKQIIYWKLKLNKLINNKIVFEFYLILRLFIIITYVVLTKIVVISTFIKIEFIQHLIPNYDRQPKS